MKNRFLIVVLALFIISRFFIFDLSYHQDEYKWGLLVNPVFGINLQSDHPPLVAVLYKTVGSVFGFDHLRLLPIAVSVLNLILIYLIARKMYGEKAARWAVGILVVSVYYLLASTQIDIDGALLPFFGLLAIYSYLNLDLTNLFNKKHRSWLIIFALSIIGGFLIKLSFILFIAAIGTEYLFSRPKKKEFGKMVLIVIGGVLISAGSVLLLNKLFNVARATQFLENTTHFSFFNVLSRNYSQVFFLTAKGLILASPLLLAGFVMALTSKENIKKYRLWLIYALYNILFYYVVFDFSNRTLERYLMFMIIPGAIMLGAYIAQSLKDRKLTDTVIAGIWFSIAAGIVALVLLTMKYSIFPLNPKSQYINAVKSLNFNFLLPITGGSGPIGFYVLVSLVLAFFVISLGFLVSHFIFLKNHSKKNNKKIAEVLFVGFLSFGFVYNIVLANEMINGSLYGSVDRVTDTLVKEVNSNGDIKQVITYYDIAGYDLHASGKYFKRFYTDPIFADTNVGKFSDYSGYYMVTNFPEIDVNSVYWKYLSTCQPVFQTADKDIYGYIFNCEQADKTLFSD